MSEKLRIVFMGTPEFAVPSLERLVEAGYPVVGVVTATDKLGGRGGKQLLESPVKQAARRLGIPLLQPKNLKSEEFQAELRALAADLQIVVAFRMLPEAVWAMPRLGTFNLHGSLLPKYRGAAPINWAVIEGERETGATTFFIRHEIDTGDVLQQLRIPINEADTAGDIHDRMMQDGAGLVVDTVRLIESGDHTLRKQDDGAATPAPKLNREMAEISFDRPVRRVHDFVRGLSPWPAAWTTLEGTQLKLIRCAPEHGNAPEAPGTVLTDGKTYFKIACRKGYLQVHQLQLAGRKRMAVEDFLRGVEISPSTVLG